MTALRMHLLGDFELLDGAGRRIAISSRKSRGLLAILAVSATASVSRQRLANLLWGDRQDEQARASLRQTLASLRRDFAAVESDILSLGDEAVSLDRTKVVTDAAEIQRLAQSDEISDVRSTFELYRGPFLSDTTIDADEFEEWVRSERARFHSAIVAVAEKLWTQESKERRVAVAKVLVSLEPSRS